MIKRSEEAASTRYEDRADVFDLVLKRASGRVLNAQPLPREDVGPLPSDPPFTGGATHALATVSARLSHSDPIASIDFPAVFDLATLDGTNGFRIDGAATRDKSGLPVSSAGDVNGDGFDDFIIGAQNADPDGKRTAGASFVVFGKAGGHGGELDLSSLDGTNGFRLDGVEAYDRSGISVSSAGDVNGDGFGDIIIGAVFADAGNVSGAGVSFVVFGKAGPFASSLDLAILDGTNGFSLEGVAKDDFSGMSVSSAGDINGDGFDDVIIGASSASPGGKDFAGETYLVFGHAGGFDASVDLGALDGSDGFRLLGDRAFDSSGTSVSSAGDVNGDGVDDIIIGASGASTGGKLNAGESYVVFGTRGGFAPSLDLASLDGTNGFRLDGIDESDASGISVSSAGDVNGDGFDDVVIGAWQANQSGAFGERGESYVVFGMADGFAPSLDLAALDGANGFRIAGAGPDDASGVVVSDAGDVNGDGFDDVIIGTRYGNGQGGYRAGVSYVVFGHDGGFDPSVDLATLDGSDGFRIDGIDTLDGAGSAASSAGDVNGDGFDDILVGAPRAGVKNAGESYVIFGVAPTEAVTRVGSSGDQTIRGGAFADTLSGKGGDDRLAGGGGADTLDGGTGKDWAYYDVAEAGVRASLASPDTNTGEAAGDRYNSIENLRGSAFVDTLVGDKFDNRLRGDGGADKLSGFNGDDALIGDAGHDRLTGGKGADGFFFDSLSSADSDTITDFASGVDRIVLDDVFGLPGGALSPGSFVVSGTAQDADDRLIYNAANGNLFFDADGTGASTQVLLATLKGEPTLTVGDFQVDGAVGALPNLAIEGPASDALLVGFERGAIAQIGMLGFSYAHGASLLPACHAMLV